MTVELTTQLIGLINTLPQTTQMLIYLGIYTLCPLIIIALLKINNRIDKEGDFFITSGYCDLGVRCASALIADAINKMCQKNN